MWSLPGPLDFVPIRLSLGAIRKSLAPEMLGLTNKYSNSSFFTTLQAKEHI